jgi:hypothetical protein
MTCGKPLMINPFGELCWRVEVAPVKRGLSAKHSSYLVRKSRRDLRLQGGGGRGLSRQSLTRLRRSLKVLKEWNDEAFNKSELTYQHYGSSFEFYGLDDSQKLHGIETDSFGLTRLSKQARTTSTNWSKGAKASGFLTTTRQRMSIGYTTTY